MNSNLPRPEEQLGPVLQCMRVLWGFDHALQIASKQMEASLGITGPQRLVVRLVGRFPGISAGELAELQRVHPSTLTGVLRRLQARGVLRRRSDPQDGRRALFWLTAKGAKMNRSKIGTVEAAVEIALASVPNESVRGAYETITAVLTALDRTRAAPKRRKSRP